MPFSDQPQPLVKFAVESFRRCRDHWCTLWPVGLLMSFVMLLPLWQMVFKSFVMPHWLPLAFFCASALVSMFLGALLFVLHHRIDAPLRAPKRSVRFIMSVYLVAFATAAIQYCLTVLGFFILIIPGIYLMVGLVLAIPMALFDQKKPWDAVSSSMRAMKGNMWRFFLLLMATAVVSAAFESIFLFVFKSPSLVYVIAEILWVSVMLPWIVGVITLLHSAIMPPPMQADPA